MKKSLLLLIIVIGTLSGCQKLERDNPLDGQGNNNQSGTTETYSAPSVVTSNVSNITSSSAKCGGTVTGDGGVSVTSRGVCWGTSQNPTTSDNIKTSGSGVGNYNVTLNNLSPNTTYYVRAYATNSEGTGYGEQKKFTTESGNEQNDCIEYESYSINHESVADNMITPGENLRIGINYISNTTWGASITISTTSPYAECESGAAHLSSNDVIMHHQPSYPSSASGFLVHILEDAPMGATININVHISSNSGSLSEDSFTLTVGESW